MKIKINSREFEVQVAASPEEKEQGLQEVHYLPQDEGMLFVYDEEQEHSFWMKNTRIPLDIIAIDDEETVTAVFSAQPEDEDPIVLTAQYVLELNANSGVVVGDVVDIPDSEEIPQNSEMLVLNEQGQVQMQLKGGERIFSRHNTKILLKLAHKAYKTKEDKDYAKLGKKVFKFLEIQMGNETQYVELEK